MNEPNISVYLSLRFTTSLLDQGFIRKIFSGEKKADLQNGDQPVYKHNKLR